MEASDIKYEDTELAIKEEYIDPEGVPVKEDYPALYSPSTDWNKLIASTSSKESPPLITHNKENWDCPICGKNFKYRRSLVYHIKLHSGEKPFDCQVCGQKFAQKGHLVRHLKRHSGERAFSCNDCTYKCTVKDTLINHMRKHTGEKPYICEACGQRFTQRSPLVRHLKRHSELDIK